jgi:hypothetical protein
MNGRRGMAQRTGPGIHRGWTPSPVRAARRIAEMNAMRRAREAERVAIFWNLVEERGLRLEQLTTRVRRDLVAQAKEIQQWCDRQDERARAETTVGAAPRPAAVLNAPVPAKPGPVRAQTAPPGAARAPALRGRVRMA